MSSLLENLLKVKVTDHREIQEEIRRNLGEGEKFYRLIEALGIDGDYLRDRDEIEKEYQRRQKGLTATPEPKSFREPKR